MNVQQVHRVKCMQMVSVSCPWLVFMVCKMKNLGKERKDTVKESFLHCDFFPELRSTEQYKYLKIKIIGQER